MHRAPREAETQGPRNTSTKNARESLLECSSSLGFQNIPHGTATWFSSLVYEELCLYLCEDGRHHCLWKTGTKESVLQCRRGGERGEGNQQQGRKLSMVMLKRICSTVKTRKLSPRASFREGSLK